RPWTETPFLFQGFFINHQYEIEELQHYCQYVFVDAVKSANDSVHARAGMSHNGHVNHAAGAASDVRYSPSGSTSTDSTRKREVYVTTRSIEQEMAAAGEIHADASRTVETILTGLQMEGR